MKKSALYLLLFTLVPLLLNAQVTVRGHAPDFAGKTIRLYSYTDFVTKNTILKDQTTVQENGQFELSYASSSIHYIKITSDHVAAHIYTQPDALYEVEFPLPPSIESRTFGKEAETEVIFNNLYINDINANIIDFNYNYNLFFQRNYELLKKLFSPRNYSPVRDSSSIVNNGPRSTVNLFAQLEGFKKSMDSLYVGSDSEYFRLYRHAVLGDLMMSSKATMREIFETYIEPYDFSIDHPVFTQLHERFYKFYLVRNSDYFGETELDSALNKSGDWRYLSSLMEKDDFAAELSRREVIACLAIREAWRGINNKSNAIEILSEIIRNGSSSQAKELAEQVLGTLTSNEKGFKLNDFTFEDQFNQPRKLSEFRGKPTLLAFSADWCGLCKQEEISLDELIATFQEEIQFIKIEIETEGFPYTNQTNDRIVQSMISEYSPIISDLGIRSLPHYILLDEEANVVISNTPLPSAGLEAALRKIGTASKGPIIRTVGSKEN